MRMESSPRSPERQTGVNLLDARFGQSRPTLEAMSARRATRSILVSAVATVAALAVVGGGSVDPASAMAPTIPTSPTPRPESSSPLDRPRDQLLAPHPGQLVLSPADTRTIPQRLAAAGADPALGSRVSAVVLDAATGEMVYGRNSSLALMPASNQKLVTAFVALQSLGPFRTFTTVVKLDASRSIVWLKGGGDPALTTAQLRTLSEKVRTDLASVGRRSISVRVDDSLFPSPTNATGWKASYVPGDVAPVRALVVDGHNVADTAISAGNVFAAELRRVGIVVPSVARGTAPQSSSTLAGVRSPSVAALVAKMVNASSNDYAEMLHRHSSLSAGSGATWSAANAHAFNVLKSRGGATPRGPPSMTAPVCRGPTARPVLA